DRAELARITLRVVRAELEDLALEQERGDSSRAFTRDVELANELVLGELEIILRDLTVDDLAKLLKGRADRALDVDRVDTHADDPGGLAAGSAERAEHVVRQAELVADHVPDTARERVRREDHVCDPGRDKTRIGPRQPGPTQHDVTLRFVGHDIELSDGRRHSQVGHLALLAGAASAQRRERLRGSIKDLLRLDPSGHDKKGAACEPTSSRSAAPMPSSASAQALSSRVVVPLSIAIAQRRAMPGRPIGSNH